ncbi:unnamed protein product [Allacma fusca]|uniref:Uncharacterized protein n=1 Tax=Allacma fusca TaxID=39272 RepID=A0A8J2NVD9_9HEXA|nr:unnamed protein product [Allacma fusca]
MEKESNVPYPLSGWILYGHEWRLWERYFTLGGHHYRGIREAEHDTRGVKDVPVPTENVDCIVELTWNHEKPHGDFVEPRWPPTVPLYHPLWFPPTIRLQLPATPH